MLSEIVTQRCDRGPSPPSSELRLRPTMGRDGRVACQLLPMAAQIFNADLMSVSVAFSASLT